MRFLSEGRVVITADLDFPRLVALAAASGPGLILFGGGDYSDEEMRDLLARVLRQVPADVLGNAVCVVDKTRVRVRLLPLARGRPTP